MAKMQWTQRKKMMTTHEENSEEFQFIDTLIDSVGCHSYFIKGHRREEIAAMDVIDSEIQCNPNLHSQLLQPLLLDNNPIL